MLYEEFRANQSPTIATSDPTDMRPPCHDDVHLVVDQSVNYYPRFRIVQITQPDGTTFYTPLQHSKHYQMMPSLPAE